MTVPVKAKVEEKKPEVPPKEDSKKDEIIEKMLGPEIDEDEEEAEAENMLKLMDEIKYARDNNQGLNDEERRANAEAIMMKLANMMDLGDDYDDE